MTTKVAFLRGTTIALGPLTREESLAIKEMPARLSPAQVPRRTGVDRIFALAARDATMTLVGGISLEDIDWSQRSARIVARWGEGAPHAAEALALILQYATGELALQGLLAETGDDAWGAVLTGAGFSMPSRGRFLLESAKPFLPPSGA